MIDMPIVYESKTVRARKPAKCCECDCAIDVGSEYNRHSGLWDGQWSTFKMCLLCGEISSEVFRHVDYDEGYEFGGLFYWWEEGECRSHKDVDELSREAQRHFTLTMHKRSRELRNRRLNR